MIDIAFDCFLGISVAMSIFLFGVVVFMVMTDETPAAWLRLRRDEKQMDMEDRRRAMENEEIKRLREQVELLKASGASGKSRRL